MRTTPFVITILCAAFAGFSSASLETASATQPPHEAAAQFTSPELGDSSLPAATGGQTANIPEPGEVLVKFRKGSKSSSALQHAQQEQVEELETASLPESFRQLLAKHKAKGMNNAFRVAALGGNEKPKAAPPKDVSSKKSREDLFRWYRLVLPPDANLDEVVRDLKKHGDVETAELNGTLRLAQVIDPPITGLPDSTTDPSFNAQWHLPFTSSQRAWNYLKENGRNPGGSRDVVVAIIDSGVDANHEDLVANMWTNGGEIPGNEIDDDNNGFVDDIHGCSVVSDSRSHSGDSSDQYGHGTHVAGIVASTAFNGKGGVGVAFNVQIMSVRAAQYSGTLTFLDVSEAVLYAIDNGAEVINMSFGGYGRSQILEDALEVALNQAMLVAAAGNNSGPQMYPASLHYVIGVGACTEEGTKTWFSNKGDVYAPGESIFSTLPGNNYAKWSGTSMAAPIVSGIGALMRSYYWQRDIWSTRFLMGGLFNAGGTNAYVALTVLPKPGIDLLSTWLFDHKELSQVNDADGRIDSGETIHIGIEIVNQAGRADNVFAILQARAPGAYVDDPYVHVDVPLVEFGSIGPWNVADNGFVYDGDGVITGFSDPFVITVLPNCPNDHVIPFELLVVAQDGWDPDHPFIEFPLRFNFTVQRGKNVPNVISSDLTLTADQYWIIGGPVLVEAGATLRVEPGTQLQWGAISDDPYNPGPQNGYLVVRGDFLAHGTAEKPINLFPSYLVDGQVTKVTVDQGGAADLSYATVQNPDLSSFRFIDHVKFVWDAYPSKVEALRISRSSFHKFRGGGTIAATNLFDTCLFDAGWIVPSSLQFRNCVFLQDNENERPLNINLPWSFSRKLSRDGIGPELFYNPRTTNGYTYVILPLERGDLRLAETMARYYGGHVTSVRNQAESDFLRGWVSEAPMVAMTMNWFVIGLDDALQPGQFTWTDGSPFTFTDWRSAQPRIPSWSDFRTVVFGEEYRGQGKTFGCYVQSGFSWRWNGEPDWWNNFLLRLPGTWTTNQLIAPITNGTMLNYVCENFPGSWRHNAFLNKYWDPTVSRWMRFTTPNDPDGYSSMRDNFWGTDTSVLIDHAIQDYYDNFQGARVDYGTPLAHGYETTYPFVENAYVNGVSLLTVPAVEAGPANFRVEFNRNMNTNIEPFVTFGPSPPHTDFQVKPRDENFIELTNGWVDPRTWEGQVWITPVTGSGYHLLRVSDAVAQDDPWLVSGYDVARFRFRVQIVGVASMTLQANGREGAVELMWQQNDYDLLAGYNLYRASSIDGPYTKLNTSVIPPGSEHYLDPDVTPAVPMFYRFTVLSTEFQESEPSNVASASALDTIPPVLTHTPVTVAVPGRQLRLEAVATDNVRVTGVRVFHRLAGSMDYTPLTMVNTLSNTWSAVLSASVVQPPGIEYYLVASDGLSQVYSGTPLTPHTIAVNDQPTLASVTPNHGPATGGTAVTLAGLQFQAGASVLFGGVLASNIVLLSPNQIACVTPPHFPALVEVKVINTNQSQSTLLNAFTYESIGTVISLPVISGDYGQTVEIPITVANLTGLRAVDLAVTFDTAVLSAQSARPGPLAAGCSLTANTGVAGRVTLSLASPTAISGSGTLAYIAFEVVGHPPASSALGFANLLLNDGAIAAATSAGEFTVNGFWNLSGHVLYYRDARPVSEAAMALVGVGSHLLETDATGSFVLTNLPTGAYTLTPTKTDAATGITSYDASLVLQSAAGLLSLATEQRIAADVNCNGTISSMDAAYILEKAVGLIEVPFPNAGKVWAFAPEARSYSMLNADQAGQDFVAVLLGDVSGNWSVGSSEAGLAGLDRVTLALDTGLVRTNRDFTRIVFKTTEGAPLVYSMDLTLEYDSLAASIEDVQRSGAAQNCLVASNTNQPGSITVALASATPLASEGYLLGLALSNNAGSQLRITRVSINEGSVRADIAETPVLFDQDHDGVLDLDEVAIYHTDPQNPDSDSDDLTDGQELRAGTDPNDSGSCLQLVVTPPDADGEVSLHWSTAIGRKYVVESTTSLSPASWSSVGPALESTGTTLHFTVYPQVQTPARFFRIRLVEE